MRNWMAAKAAYDRHIGEAMCVRLDAIILRNSVDLEIMPEVPPYPENLIKPWELEEPPYEKEEKENENEADHPLS